jgi:hypothetical protein
LTDLFASVNVYVKDGARRDDAADDRAVEERRTP